MNYPCKKEDQSLQDYFSRKGKMDKPLIMAHRNGPPAKGVAENSIEALERTWQLNPCVIQEIDIRMTRDSQLVLMHDTTIDRTTTGKGKIKDILYADLQALQLKDPSGTILEQSRVPTLAEALAYAKGKILLALDMKPGTDPERLMRAVTAAGTFKNIFIICYTIREAQQVHAAHPEAMIALGFNNDQQIAAVKNSGIPYKNIIALTPGTLQGKEYYDRIHDMGIMASFGAFVSTDTISAQLAGPVYKKIHERGADIICTDSLEKLLPIFY